MKVYHFIEEDSPVKNYIPEYLSLMNKITLIKGGHENDLEID